MKKSLKVSRSILGSICLAFFVCAIVARFTTSYNEKINPVVLSGIMFKVSFVLFSINMMLTIMIDNSKSTKRRVVRK